jgi:hypothetical protein
MCLYFELPFSPGANPVRSVSISFAADDVAEKFNNRRAVQATNCSLAMFSRERQVP